MFGWIKRLGRKPEVQPETRTMRLGTPTVGIRPSGAPVFAPDFSMAPLPGTEAYRVRRIAQLQCDIKQAKRRKKKHSHLSAELARLEQADRSPTHMIQEPGQ